MKSHDRTRRSAARPKAWTITTGAATLAGVWAVHGAPPGDARVAEEALHGGDVGAGVQEDARERAAAVVKPERPPASRARTQRRLHTAYSVIRAGVSGPPRGARVWTIAPVCETGRSSAPGDAPQWSSHARSTAPAAPRA
jgi:hypothetical protein